MTTNKPQTKPESKKRLKRKGLRYNEYHDIQEDFDKLYEDSRKNKNFTNLLELITDKRNIELAYRNIRTNKGSKTAGVNHNTIESWGNTNTEHLIEYVNNRLLNYRPQKVRRVFIPKGKDKVRPLGIPTIEDRIIQQCIKQVLEPICEAKFHPSSYGFRPNRKAENAIGELHRRINTSKAYHVVSVDIKSFFDEINHGKLLKQLWHMGIQDKRLISIISRMLKAEIEGEGKPTKGTPQGGILSPLLANVVLNELDWWISSQWETFNTKRQYSENYNKYTALRNSSGLKEVYIIRYADDFKICCATAGDARNIYAATTKWLKERLQLEVSQEKSEIVDIRKSSTEFLGFRFKAKMKNKKYVLYSHMGEKAKKNCEEKLIKRISEIQSSPKAKTVGLYNSTVLGMQNYYKIATHVNLDFKEIGFRVNKVIKNRLRNIVTDMGEKNLTYKKFYKNNYKTLYIGKINLFPIQDVQTRTALFFTQETCNYTKQGRALIHQNLEKINMNIVHYLMKNPEPNKNMEYNNFRVSLYVGQNGLCGITRSQLNIGSMEVHHIKPRAREGTDEYKNLIFVTENVHKLIHATKVETIENYCKKVKPDVTALKKINKYRKIVGNNAIKWVDE